ncbi:MAG TPA: hypothetical protein GXZ90_07920 [Clostridiales bacterium]|nr:hypothetical protein [Clostridiales bacterium]
MIKFFSFPWTVRIFVTFMLGICVLAQTLAILFNYYQHRLNTERIMKTILEILVLSKIIVFSILYGQVVNGYKTGFVVSSGYENIRIIIFFLILILSTIIYILKKDLLILGLIPLFAISLPIAEKLIASSFPLTFIIILTLLLVRSIRMCIYSIIAIRTDITVLSIIHAIDTLHTGVLFSEEDGHILLSNHQMQNLMNDITGKVFRNAIQFYDMLVSGKFKSRYTKAELDGQMVYLLPDGAAWMFTKTNILFQMKNYIHISVTDVSKLWTLTVKLQLQNQEISDKSNDLKKTIANLHILSQEKEIENAKMRAHNILGQRLTVILRIIQNDHNLDYDLLTSLSKGLLAELKAEQTKIRAIDEIKNIQEIFAAIGVDVNFEGELLNDDQQTYFLVDIIREGCTNAVRHGLATQINIKIEYKNGFYNLTINNNGYITTIPITLGSGIGVMKKKLENQGGKLTITHRPLFELSIVLPGGD